MITARPRYIIASALALTCLTAALVLPSEVSAAAGGIQTCTVGSTCTIGEFLYDDSSAPIASPGATCTITSKYPDHSSYLATQPLSGGLSDGWYYYEFAAPATTGMYSTQISCTVSGDTLSIDKSFQVASPITATTDNGAIATAVWGFSGKTLDSWGSLPEAIWSYSTRTVDSISSFGTLISDIWANATRTLTGATLDSGSLATKSDVEGMATSSGTVTNITNNTTSTTNNTTSDISQSVIDSINSIKSVTSETRLLLEQVVNKPVVQNVLEETTVPISQKLEGTRAQANQLYVNNQYLTAQSASLAAGWSKLSGKEVLDAVIGISNVLGESADASSVNTMFGSTNWIRDSWSWSEADGVYSQIASAEKIISDLKESLADYQKTPAELLLVKSLVKNSVALEKIIGVTSDAADKKTLFAKIGSTQAFAANLDAKDGQIGKVLGIYTKSKDAKAISTQLSDLQNQVMALNKVPGGTAAIVRVSSTDPNSVINNLLSLKGIINSNKKLLSLGSGQTMVNVWLEVGSIIFKTVATNPSTLVSQKVDIKYYLPPEIKVEDILKTDAGLTTNYDAEKNQIYVSGTFTLAAGQTRTFSVETRDIWTYSPQELSGLRAQAAALAKPLEKTAYYAQGVSLTSDINANLDQIDTIMAGVQTPEDKIRAFRQAEILRKSVDEKIVGLKDLVTQASGAGSLFGFVGGAQTIAVWGLIIVIAAGFIFMTIYMRTITAKAKAGVQAEAGEGVAKENPGQIKKQVHRSTVHPVVLVAVMLLTSTISAGTTGFVVNNIVSKNYEEKLSVLGTQTVAPVATPSPAPVLNDANTLGTGGQYLVIVSDTPTGFLRVRKTPGGVEIAKVNTGDKLPFVEENKGWYHVTLESGEDGWISKEYSSKE